MDIPTCGGYGVCVHFCKFDVLTLEYVHVGVGQNMAERTSIQTN